MTLVSTSQFTLNSRSYSNASSLNRSAQLITRLSFFIDRGRVGTVVHPPNDQNHLTICCGPNGEFVTQFRLRSLQLNMETVNLARTIYGQFTPQVTFRGQIGCRSSHKLPTLSLCSSRPQGRNQSRPSSVSSQSSCASKQKCRVYLVVLLGRT